MEIALKSNNIKTEMQASLPPLVMDALVQTDVVSRENGACQTEKIISIDCEVQANPERTFSTQTIKQEIKQENVGIAMPNTISNSRFGLKKAKKRKTVSNGTSTASKGPSQKDNRTESPSMKTDSQQAKKRKISSDAFRKGSGKIHAHVIETLPLDTPDKQMTPNQLTKILKWDPGKYLRLSKEYFSINLKIVHMFLKHHNIMHL